MDGEFRKTVMVIRELAFRLDNREYDNALHMGMGRSWTSVSLTMSECDLQNASTTFSNNALTTPSTVFSAAVQWPTVTGWPASKPAPWAYRFPFSTSWVYTGRQDISADFNMAGGVLANSSSWISHLYYLDSYNNWEESRSWPVYYGKGKTGGCVDPYYYYSGGATVKAMCTTYSQAHPYPPVRNNIDFRFFSYHTAPGQIVVHALGTAGSPTGTSFPGVSCNRLHLDLGKPTMFFFPIAGAPNTGLEGYAAAPWLGYFRYNPAYVGLELWWQAAWNNSKTGQVLLTPAAVTEILAIPVPLGTYKRTVLFQPDTTYNKVTGGFTQMSQTNPIIRYK